MKTAFNYIYNIIKSYTTIDNHHIDNFSIDYTNK